MSKINIKNKFKYFSTNYLKEAVRRKIPKKNNLSVKVKILSIPKRAYPKGPKVLHREKQMFGLVCFLNNTISHFTELQQRKFFIVLRYYLKNGDVTVHHMDFLLSLNKRIKRLHKVLWSIYYNIDYYCIATDIYLRKKVEIWKILLRRRKERTVKEILTGNKLNLVKEIIKKHREKEEKKKRKKLNKEENSIGSLNSPPKPKFKIAINKEVKEEKRVPQDVVNSFLKNLAVHLS